MRRSLVFERDIVLRNLIVIGLVVVAFVLGGCEKTELAQQEGGSGAIDVMSFNVRYGSANDGRDSWRYRRDMVCEFVRDCAAEVIGVQEALRFQIEAMAEAMSGYEWVGLGREDGKEKGEYCAIFYDAGRFELVDSGTFWLSETPEVIGSKSWNTACERICTWVRLVERDSGKGLYVYNTHFDHVSQLAREKSSELIAKRISERNTDEPFVLMGDLNADENNRAVLYLKGVETLDGSKISVGMVDTFRAVRPDEKEVGTFNAFKGYSGAGKIDYVLVGDGIEVLDAEIVRYNIDGRYPSDHYPVNAKIQLR